MTLVTPRSTNGGFGGKPLVVEVGVGEWVVGCEPQRLLTQALGSCVGVTLWDAQTRRGAMGHVMLPAPVDSSLRGDMRRFASHAIPGMASQLHNLGVPTARLVAKLTGGAAMFHGESAVAHIGSRNLDEVKRQLSLLRIPVVAEDTGGSHARTIELHLDTGLLLVRSYRYGVHEL